MVVIGIVPLIIPKKSEITIANEPKMVELPMIATADFGKTLYPIPLIRNPKRGKTGISQTNSNTLNNYKVMKITISICSIV